MKFRRLNMLLLVTAAAFLVSGCVKLKHATTVMPDASGKMTFTVGANKQMQQPGQPDMTEVNLLEMNDDSSGFVAYSKPKVTEEAGWKYVTFTAYFDDINKVRLGKEGEGNQPPATFTFAKEGEGYKLSITNAMTASMGKGIAEQEDPEPQQMAMVQAMLAGFKIEETYEMPGAVSAIPAPGTSAARVATVVVTDADVFNKAKGKVLVDGNPRAVVSGASEVTEDAMTAWKAEMAAAKVEWAAYKQELEAKKAAEAVEEAPAEMGGME